MPDIFELLNSDLGKQLITKTGNEAGISSEQTSEVLSMALPALMGAMQQNATSAQGAQSLLGALTSKHDGSILDNLGDSFSRWSKFRCPTRWFWDFRTYTWR